MNKRGVIIGTWVMLAAAAVAWAEGPATRPDQPKDRGPHMRGDGLMGRVGPEGPGGAGGTSGRSA